MLGPHMDRRRVLIVGGGIAGLAHAPMLARTGDEVEVVERARVAAACISDPVGRGGAAAAAPPYEHR